MSSPIDAGSHEEPGQRPDAENPPSDKTVGQMTSWRDALPWEGKPSRWDKILLASIFVITAFMLAMTPVKPFLLAHHPILLELVTGSKAAVGAGAAFARIGQAPLWLVVVCGVIGAAKFDWIFWLMGRRWGARVVRLFAPNDKLRGYVERAETLPRWVAPLAAFLAVFPGIPAGMAYAFAGWQKLKFRWFLAINLLSTLVVVGLVAGLGFWAGQRAVDIVLLVDKYALWVSLALIVGAAFWSTRKQLRQQKAAQQATARED